MDPQLQQMLEDLRDVHSPATAGWWPLAPGWWILATLLVVAVIALVFVFRRRRHLVAYKKEALRLLAEAYQDMKRESNAERFLTESAGILRRVMLYQQGRREVSQLSGEQWRDLLNRATNTRLSDDSLDALLVQQYRRQPQFDSESLYEDLQGYISNLEPVARV